MPWRVDFRRDKESRPFFVHEVEIRYQSMSVFEDFVLKLDCYGTLSRDDFSHHTPVIEDPHCPQTSYLIPWRGRQIFPLADRRRSNTGSEIYADNLMRRTIHLHLPFAEEQRSGA